MKKNLLFVSAISLFVLLTSTTCLKAQLYSISTVAGNGTASYAGDYNAATAAELNYPTAVTADNSGNVYISDSANQRIRQISSAGVITTLIGSGTAGFSGDGNSASGGAIDNPEGVTVDASGNVYIADMTNNRIREITISNSTINTVAGSANSGFAGDGAAATLASLKQPHGVAVDASGNIYIADYGNNRIREVNASGVISTIAGTATAGYNGDNIAASTAEISEPCAVAVDNSGNIYIADAGNQRIRKINTSGIISTVAGTGTAGFSGDGAAATAAQINSPYGIAVDVHGNLFISDHDNGRIRMVNTGGIITTIAGSGNCACAINDNGPATAGTFDNPCAISVDDSGKVYIADNKNQRIRKLLTCSLPSGIAATSNGPLCTGGQLILTGVGTGVTHWSWAGPNAYTDTLQSPTTYSVTTASAGTYTLTASSACGTATPVTVNVVINSGSPTTPTITGSTTICASSTSNTYTTSSTGATSFTWTVPTPVGTIVSGQGTATITVTAAAGAGSGNVSVTATNGCGTSSAGTLAVTVGANPTITASSNAPVCSGGTISLTSTGTGSSFWNWTGPNSFSSTVQNPSITSATTAAEGTYTLTGKSSVGCTSQATTIFVRVDAPIAISLTSVNESCLGSSNANIKATATGGTLPYTYSWTTGSTYTYTGSLIYNLAIGTYTATLTDSLGCTKTNTSTITQPASLQANTSSINASCGASNGTITVNTSGGTTPYNYSWSTTPLQTTNTATGLAAGGYTVTITDGNGCTTTNSATILSSSGPSITPTVTNSTCKTSNGKVTITTTGGTPPYRYSWNNGDTLSTDSNMAAGNYIITVTDQNGCSTFDAINVNDASAPIVNVNSLTNVKCNGDTTGAIAVAASGGTSPYKYLWSNGAITTAINDLSAGPYQVTVTDAAGCVVVQNVNVTQATALVLTTSSTLASCKTSNGGASVTVTGGASPYVYAWSNTNITSAINSVAAGTYSVGVTDNNGCTISADISVGNASGPLVTIDSAIDMDCAAKTQGSIIINATSGTPPYRYAWSNSASTKNISNLTAGNYAVTVTDTAGCVGTANATITTALPPGAEICMVTVNPANNENTLVWNVTSGRIAKYIIYKQTTSQGIFNIIGRVRGDSGTFIDTASNPDNRSWQYELSELDSCGQASPISQSVLFQTIHLTANIDPVNPTKVDLVWDSYQGAAYKYFIIYRDSVPGITSDSIALVSVNTYGYTDTPPNNHIWYYHVGIGGTIGCTGNLLAPYRGVDAVNYNTSKSNTGNVILGVPTSVQNVSDINSLQVFPNPNRGVFTMSFELNKLQDVNVKIYNALGQVMTEEQYGNLNGQVVKQYDISAYSKGIYYMRLITNTGVSYSKVVIQ